MLLQDQAKLGSKNLPRMVGRISRKDISDPGFEVVVNHRSSPQYTIVETEKTVVFYLKPEYFEWMRTY